MIWTRTTLKSLQQALEGRGRDEVITFEGQEVLVSYGRYLCEYLDRTLAPEPKVARLTLVDVEQAYHEAMGDLDS